jgi:hypothetical protein
MLLDTVVYVLTTVLVPETFRFLATTSPVSGFTYSAREAMTLQLVWNMFG